MPAIAAPIPPPLTRLRAGAGGLALRYLELLVQGRLCSGVRLPEDQFDAIQLAKQGLTSEIEELVGNGFDVNYQDQMGFTMLLEAAEFGHPDLFWRLLELGADPLAKAAEGYGLIHAIALGGDVSMLEHALTIGCDLDCEVQSGDHAGYRVRDYAQLGRNTPILKWLNRRSDETAH